MCICAPCIQCTSTNTDNLFIISIDTDSIYFRTFLKLAVHVKTSDDEIFNSLSETCISIADEVTVSSFAIKYKIKFDETWS